MDRYEKNEQIGEGGMQTVYRAEDKIFGRAVALKIPKNESAEKRFQASAVLSARISHPNIACTLDYFEEAGSGRLIEEYVPGIDLGKWLDKYASFMDPHLAAHVLHHLAKGMAAVHHVGAIHRDIKPGNILVSDELTLSTIKITDFGIAKMAESALHVDVSSEDSLTTNSTIVGALPYMSPELLDKEESEVTLATDVWSLGALLYRLIAGSPPFGVGPKAVHGILNGEPPGPPDFLLTKTHYQPLGEKLWRIILSCLSFDASDRPTADYLAKVCSELCYLDEERHSGVIYNYKIKEGAYGFIASDNGDNIFLHAKNFFGRKPKNGTRVSYSGFPGVPNTRAYPVMELDGDE